MSRGVTVVAKGLALLACTVVLGFAAVFWLSSRSAPRVVSAGVIAKSLNNAPVKEKVVELSEGETVEGENLPDLTEEEKNRLSYDELVNRLSHEVNRAREEVTKPTLADTAWANERFKITFYADGTAACETFLGHAYDGVWREEPRDSKGREVVRVEWDGDPQYNDKVQYFHYVVKYDTVNREDRMTAVILSDQDLRAKKMIPTFDPEKQNSPIRLRRVG